MSAEGYQALKKIKDFGRAIGEFLDVTSTDIPMAAFTREVQLPSPPPRPDQNEGPAWVQNQMHVKFKCPDDANGNGDCNFKGLLNRTEELAAVRNPVFPSLKPNGQPLYDHPLHSLASYFANVAESKKAHPTKKIDLPLTDVSEEEYASLANSLLIASYPLLSEIVRSKSRTAELSWLKRPQPDEAKLNASTDQPVVYDASKVETEPVPSTNGGELLRKAQAAAFRSAFQEYLQPPANGTNGRFLETRGDVTREARQIIREIATRRRSNPKAQFPDPNSSRERDNFYTHVLHVRQLSPGTLAEVIVDGANEAAGTRLSPADQTLIKRNSITHTNGTETQSTALRAAAKKAADKLATVNSYQHPEQLDAHKIYLQAFSAI